MPMCDEFGKNLLCLLIVRLLISEHFQGNGVSLVGYCLHTYA